jgi:hypothetical protein
MIDLRNRHPTEPPDVPKPEPCYLRRGMLNGSPQLFMDDMDEVVKRLALARLPLSICDSTERPSSAPPRLEESYARPSAPPLSDKWIEIASELPSEWIVDLTNLGLCDDQILKTRLATQFVSYAEMKSMLTDALKRENWNRMELICQRDPFLACEALDAVVSASINTKDWSLFKRFLQMGETIIPT